MPNTITNLAHDVGAMWEIVVALAAVTALIVTAGHVRQGAKLRDAAGRALASGALAAHLVVVAIATRLVGIIAGTSSDDAGQVVLMPFATIRDYLASGWSQAAAVEIGGNLLLLLPLGLLIPLAVGNDLGIRAVVTLGIGISIIIEVLQWAFSGGVASVDDVLLNAIGVAIGYLVYRAIIPKRWTRPR